MLSSLSGRTVVVTGGSKGIGKGIARVFGRHGASVLIVARGESEAAKAVEEIKAEGGEAAFCLADISQWQGAELMVRTAVELFGGIDIICANAGIFPQSTIADMSPDNWDHVMDTNLKSLFLCVKAVIPHMKEHGKGRIIVTSSITGPVTGFPGWAHYGASKSGQLGFIRTAAIELASANITINAVMPGNIYTEGFKGVEQEYLDRMAASIPLKRLGSVEDIGNAVLFFASDEAGFITGQTMIVDGGQTLPQ